MGTHINKDGLFQSDKYPQCPAGKVPLSVKDKTAQDILWLYAQRRRSVDVEFSDDLETALRAAGYAPTASAVGWADYLANEIGNGWAAEIIDAIVLRDEKKPLSEVGKRVAEILVLALKEKGKKVL